MGSRDDGRSKLGLEVADDFLDEGLGVLPSVMQVVQRLPVLGWNLPPAGVADEKGVVPGATRRAGQHRGMVLSHRPIIATPPTPSSLST